MKHLKLFVALFAMLALGVTNAWAVEVTMTAGSNGSACTVNEINGIKVGTSKAGGDMTITVPAGATSLQLYAAAWKGVTDLSINITPVSNVNPTSISLTADDGISNSSPFTLTGNAESFKHEVTLSNITSETKLTLTSSKRFVVWGATCTVAGGENPGEGGGETPEPDPDPTPDPEPEPEPETGGTGTINFNSNNVKINEASVTGKDDLGNTWTITTVGTTSFTQQPTYSQVGKSTEPATSITFTTTLPSEGNITAFSAKFGGFNGTAGTVTLKVDDTSVGTGSLNASNDVTVSNSSQATGKKLTVTVTDIAKGVKVYSISYTYTTSGSGSEETIAAPTFLIEAGTYTEAQEVTLSAEEGTIIYYTLDGTTPNAKSTEYTAPIVLDECGTTTIKAIAISGETTSSVASATYTIKLPLNNSQANPYTEVEAIAVYDGGCYDNQEVYVKGVVANAQFFSKSNTYTITLEGGFQFYKFYEAADEVTFPNDYIVAGDTLVACGKLVKFNTTYELGAGCYLVERKPYSAPKVDISNTPETAYTVAQAIALIDDLTSDLTKGVYVKGQISEVESFNDYYGSITYWIKDEEEENTFQCYSGLGLNSEKFASVDDLVVGSQVVVYGTLKKHNSTYEFDFNNYIVSLTLPSYTVTVTVNDAAFGSVQGLAAEGKYEHGAEATLNAVANDGYKFIGWTSGEDTVSIENPYTFTVTANVALVANFNEVVTETVYFVNNQGWENVNVYAWTPVPNAEWPGVAATKEAEQICGYDVYSYTAEAGAYANVIFNNGNDHKTANLDWTAGKYYVQNGWYTREEAEALLAGPDIPSVITYVLRGVGGDWTVGIALTVNPDNENEYVLLGQDIAKGDAVKVVTLTDGVATAWCGNVDEYSVAHNFDDAGNIVLAPGKYNFYFKVNEDLIYIAAVKPGPATALEDIAVEGKAVKAIINGQLIIIKNGVQYNAQGQVIK